MNQVRYILDHLNHDDLVGGEGGGGGVPEAPVNGQAYGRRNGAWDLVLGLATGGIVSGPVQFYFTPVVPNDAVTKGYVDAQLVPAFRTLVYTPNEITITGAAQFFLDVNFPMPATGLRNILVTVDPIFASNDPPGTSTWQLIYATPLIVLESPVLAYKLGNEVSAFIRAPAKFSAAVDASAGTVRVQLAVRMVGAGGTLTQVGVGGTIAPSMRTLVTVEDLGPA